MKWTKGKSTKTKTVAHTYWPHLVEVGRLGKRKRSAILGRMSVCCTQSTPMVDLKKIRKFPEDKKIISSPET